MPTIDGITYDREGKAFEYNASGHYKKLMDRDRGPRNIPPEMMNKIHAQLAAAIQFNPDMAVSSLASHVGELERFRQMKDEERMEFVRTCGNENILMAIKSIEDNLDVLDLVVGRLREVRTTEK